MHSLLQLIVRYRAFFLFVIFEILCFILIVNYNKFQSTAFFNSSNAISGSVLATTTNVSEYFALKTGNKELATENAYLKQKLFSLEKKDILYSELELRNSLLEKQLAILKGNDSLAFEEFSIYADSAYLNSLNFIPAKVIKNDVLKENNYITINKGLNHNIKKGMGVISPTGVVGKVVSVSNSYSTIKSILHVDNFVSVMFKKSKALGTLKWDAKSIKEAKLKYIPRHVSFDAGDTLVTSGYNSVFPEGIMVGVVKHSDLSEQNSYYNIDIELSTDFSNLYYVYLIEEAGIEVEEDFLKMEDKY